MQSRSLAVFPAAGAAVPATSVFTGTDGTTWTLKSMSAHAVSHETGEVIDGSVSLPMAPARCAPNSP